MYVLCKAIARIPIDIIIHIETGTLACFCLSPTSPRPYILDLQIRAHGMRAGAPPGSHDLRGPGCANRRSHVCITLRFPEIWLGSRPWLYARAAARNGGFR